MVNAASQLRHWYKGWDGFNKGSLSSQNPLKCRKCPKSRWNNTWSSVWTHYQHMMTVVPCSVTVLIMHLCYINYCRYSFLLWSYQHDLMCQRSREADTGLFIEQYRDITQRHHWYTPLIVSLSEVSASFKSTTSVAYILNGPHEANRNSSAWPSSIYSDMALRGENISLGFRTSQSPALLLYVDSLYREYLALLINSHGDNDRRALISLLVYKPHKLVRS